jgi:hypothetical protein
MRSLLFTVALVVGVLFIFAGQQFDVSDPNPEVEASLLGVATILRCIGLAMVAAPIALVLHKILFAIDLYQNELIRQGQERVAAERERQR